MKVAVKKSLIFNLIKKHVNENRTMHNPGGNFVHISNMQSPSIDPFGIHDEEDAPITPTSQVSVQLSTVAPPVEDEDYVPVSHEELIAASNVICREVPFKQIEYYYRELHRLLDRCLDRESDDELFVEEESESEEVLNETFNISKNTTIKDFNMIKESSNVRVRKKGQKRGAPISSAPVDNTPDYVDLPSYQAVPDEDKEDYVNGYELGLRQGDLDTMLADGDIDEQEYNNQTNSIELILKTGSVNFQSGYDEGIGYSGTGGTSAGIDLAPLEPDVLPFPVEDGKFEKGVRYENRSFKEFLTRQGLTEEQNADPVFDYLIESHLAVQEFSQNLEDEYTIAMQMALSDPKGFNRLPAEYIQQKVKPVQTALNFTNSSALTNQRVKERLKTYTKDETKRFMELLEKSAAMKRRIIKMMKLKLERNEKYKKATEELAKAFGLRPERFMSDIADIITEDYATYGSKTAHEEGSRSYVEKEIKKSRTKAFRVFIEDYSTRKINQAMSAREAGENVSVADVIPTFSGDSEKQNVVSPQVIIKYVTPDEFDNFKAMILTDLDDRLKQSDGSYVIYDQGQPMKYEEEDFLEIFETEMASFLDKIEEVHRPEDENLDPIDIDMDDTISQADNLPKEMLAFMKEKLAQAERIDSDWKYMAPFYGYSGPSGLRQWALKGPKRKFDLLNVADSSGQSLVVLEAITGVYYKIIDPLIDAIESIIVSVDETIAKGKDKPTSTKKGQIKSLGEQDLSSYLKSALGELKEFSELIDQNDFGDITRQYPDLINSKGVTMLRNIVGDILDKTMSSLETEMTAEISDIISDFAFDKDIEASQKDCDWAAYYFTGLIDRPFQEISVRDTRALRKNAVKKQETYTEPDALKKVGIHTAEDYLEVEELAKETITGFAQKFGTKTSRGGSVEKRKYAQQLSSDADAAVEAFESAAKPGAKKGDQKKAVDLITKGASASSEDYRQEDASLSAQADIIDDPALLDILDADNFEDALEIFKAKKEEEKSK